ncbi:C1 family peptidase [Dyadobacter bucti]|uniref:C1 family peptidase n=1 Tax=Dyadobacter bucti TaxID=2572203 RepID=UPI001108490A|nr:C1 family peptidase [Dyadobacter bucti]
MKSLIYILAYFITLSLTYAQFPVVSNPSNLNEVEINQKLIAAGFKFKIAKTQAFIKYAVGGKGDKNYEPSIESKLLVHARAKELTRIDNEAKREFIASKTSLAPSLSARLRDAGPATISPILRNFDWRTFKKVSEVQDQGSCGSCWAFSATAAYEASYLIVNNAKINVSEQDLMNCAINGVVDAGDCIGGWTPDAFEYMLKNGCSSEEVIPYLGADMNVSCVDSMSRIYKVAAWDYVDIGTEVPSVEKLKTALCEYGPISVSMNIASPLFAAYVSGVYSEPLTDLQFASGHAVVIVGWDDDKQAWLIQNSYGKEWGEQGFGWIAYNSNKIGRSARWIKASNLFFQATDKVIFIGSSPVSTR